MRRLLSLLACLVAVGGTAVGGVPANAGVADVDAAYCPYGAITGVGTWSPAETVTPAAHSFAWDTFGTCAGTGDDSGSYHITFYGTAFDSCEVGNGGGSLSGSGPEGAISGNFTFYRGGIHLYINGNFFSGGDQHTLQYWLDVLPSGSQVVCDYTTANLIGHGAIADSGAGARSAA